MPLRPIVRSEPAPRVAPTFIWTVVVPLLLLLSITLLLGMLNKEPATFLNTFSMRLIAVQTFVTGIASLGMLLVMVAGGVDLSVGSLVALVTVVIAVAVRDWGISVPTAIVMGVTIGALGGLFNGAMITGLGVVPFVATLGSLMIFRVFARWLSASTTIYVPEGAGPRWLGQLLAIEPTPAWLGVAPGVWLLSA